MKWIVHDGSWLEIATTTQCEVPAGPTRTVYVMAFDRGGISKPATLLVPASTINRTIVWDAPANEAITADMLDAYRSLMAGRASKLDAPWTAPFLCGFAAALLVVLVLRVWFNRRNFAPW